MNLTGKLLISNIFTVNKEFEKSVVLIVEDDEHDCIGFIINKETDMQVNQALLEELQQEQSLLHYGGMNSMNTIHFLHDLSTLPNTKKVISGIYWGGDISLYELITNKQSHKSIYIAGYCCWNKHDLMHEIRTKSWFIINATPELIFDIDKEKLYSDCLRLSGKTYYQIYANSNSMSLN